MTHPSPKPEGETRKNMSDTVFNEALELAAWYEGQGDGVGLRAAEEIRSRKRMPKLHDIDDDLWIATLEYVDAQVATMRKFESLALDWNNKKRLQMAMEVAQYPQRLRNMRAKEAIHET
jgi:hypothetical protein